MNDLSEIIAFYLANGLTEPWCRRGRAPPAADLALLQEFGSVGAE